jgi:hypothetical protein
MYNDKKKKQQRRQHLGMGMPKRSIRQWFCFGKKGKERGGGGRSKILSGPPGFEIKKGRIRQCTWSVRGDGVGASSHRSYSQTASGGASAAAAVPSAQAKQQPGIRRHHCCCCSCRDAKEQASKEGTSARHWRTPHWVRGASEDDRDVCSWWE